MDFIFIVKRMHQDRDNDGQSNGYETFIMSYHKTKEGANTKMKEYLDNKLQEVIHCNKGIKSDEFDSNCYDISANRQMIYYPMNNEGWFDHRFEPLFRVDQMGLES